MWKKKRQVFVDWSIVYFNRLLFLKKNQTPVVLGFIWVYVAAIEFQSPQYKLFVLYLKGYLIQILLLFIKNALIFFVNHIFPQISIAA